jgi:hypothetical protein
MERLIELYIALLLKPVSSQYSIDFFRTFFGGGFPGAGRGGGFEPGDEAGFAGASDAEAEVELGGGGDLEAAVGEL